MDKLRYRIILVLSLVILLFFTYRLYDSYRALVEKSVYGTSDVQSIRGWMNIKYVSRVYDANLTCLCTNFNLSMADCEKTLIWETIPENEKDMSHFERRLLPDPSILFEKVILCQKNPPGPRDWMDIKLISRLYESDMECLCERLSVGGDCPNTKLKDLNEQEGGDFKERVDSAIALCRAKVKQ